MFTVRALPLLAVSLLLGLAGTLRASETTPTDSSSPTVRSAQATASADTKAISLDHHRPMQFALRIENDTFARNNSDRYYTNAEQFSATYMRDDYPTGYEALLRLLPGKAKTESSRTIGFTLAQYMYTPSDIKIAEPAPGNRPYAGWLYVGLQGMKISKDELDNDLYCNTLVLNLGVVGPSSQSESVQKWFHHVVGADQPQGWDTQMPDMLAFDVMFESRRKCSTTTKDRGLAAEFFPYVGGNVGNVFVQGRAGATVRAGLNMPSDFGPLIIRPTKALDSSSPKAGAYVFGTWEGRYVVNNVFLDGTRSDYPGAVTKSSTVDDLIFGGSLYADRFTLTYSMVTRGKEFETQSFNHHRFGSFTLTYTN